ncbi:MAG: hypothetical protein ACP5D7_25955 [Limnospira sp.]
MQVNSIPSVEDIPFDVSPSARSLLADILSQLAAVKEEVAELREEGRQKDQRIADLEASLEAHEGFDGRERASDRQRISKLEAPAPALREETAKGHLDRLFSEMHRLRIMQVTTKDAARLLGISKRQMKDVKPYLATDSRFVIVKNPHHKQRHLIRLV